MTAIALQQLSGRAPSRRGFKRFVLDLIDGFREARDISDRYKQLSHLSDAELGARGLRREDLPRLAFTGRA